MPHRIGAYLVQANPDTIIETLATSHDSDAQSLSAASRAAL
jgi:hypothetical protein